MAAFKSNFQILCFCFFSIVQISRSEQYLSSAVGISCNEKNCPSERGFCVGPTVCECKERYLNDLIISNSTINNDESSSYCYYYQKSQTTAFILELIFPMGVSHFYVGNFILGICKLILVLLICFLGCYRISLKTKVKQSKLYFLMASSIITCVFLVSWQIFDLVYFGLNKYLDWNGQQLYPW